MTALVTLVAALAFSAAALIAAYGALAARSLFASCLHMVVASACVSVALLALGAGAAALAVALVGVGLGLAWQLGAVLLSARAAKASGAGPLVLAAIAAIGVGALCLFFTADLAARPPSRIGDEGGLAFWLASLAAVAGLGCAGVLGFGERGAFETDGPRP